jgi:hypothetical protein
VRELSELHNYKVKLAGVSLIGPRNAKETQDRTERESVLGMTAQCDRLAAHKAREESQET